tara:strand:- start:8012 stop:9163 length:1152 start_codon:yes stop_codon:yes gene_type:complete
MENSRNYQEFIRYAKQQLEETDNGELNGFDILYDYYMDYPPDYLINDDSDYFREEIDRLAQTGIDETQSLLRDKESDWLLIEKEKWKLNRNHIPPTIAKSKLYQKLTAKEEALLSAASTDISPEQRKALVNLYHQKVNTLGSEEEKYQTAKLIVDKYISSELAETEYKHFLITAGELGEKNKTLGIYKYFEHLAKLNRNKYEHESAAYYFSKAMDASQVCKENNDITVELARNMRRQYELCANEDKASEAYIQENDLKALGSKKKRTKLIYFILKHLSDYCQNPKKVASCALILIVFSTFVFSIVGIIPSGKTSSQSLFVDTIEWYKVIWDALYFSVVTFTTLGYGDFAPGCFFSRIMAEFLAINGLFLSSLFLVTLIRKYGR